MGKKNEGTVMIKEEFLQKGMCGWLLTETQCQWFFFKEEADPPVTYGKADGNLHSL